MGSSKRGWGAPPQPKQREDDIAALADAVAATSLQTNQKDKAVDSGSVTNNIETKQKPQNESAKAKGGNKSNNAQAKHNTKVDTSKKKQNQNVSEKKDSPRKEPYRTPRQAKKLAEQERSMATRQGASNDTANSGYRQYQQSTTNGQDYADSNANGGYYHLSSYMANGQGSFSGNANNAFWPLPPHVANARDSTAHSGWQQPYHKVSNGPVLSDNPAHSGWRHLQPSVFASTSAGGEAPIFPTKVPPPTAAYMEQAKDEPRALASPQPLLVILDLNGTILRKNRRHGMNPCTAVMRPHSEAFLKWLFEESNHTVMVWSSITPRNVNDLVSRYIPAPYANKLAAVWARNTLRLSEREYMGNGPVYKRLEWVWASNVIQQRYPSVAAVKAGVPAEKHTWGQHNTILIDDSSLKAATQPFNHLEIPEFVQMSQWTFPEDQINVLDQVKAYLQATAMWSDTSQRVSRAKFLLLTQRPKSDEDFDRSP